MSNVIHAIYEQGVFRPIGPVDLPEQTRVEFEPRVVSEASAAGPFWQSQSLDDLAAQQRVLPVSDLDELSDLWPADDDPDELLEHIQTEREARRSLAQEARVMSVVLLDTNVASLLHPKKKAAALRRRYEPHMRGETLALSFQSVAELWDWAEANRWGAKARSGLDLFIRRFLVIPYDVELAKVWARAMEAARQEGRRLESGDCWIAATAVHRGITLLTHDRDLVGRNIAGLQVISYVDETQSA